MKVYEVKVPMPQDEASRLDALQRYDILDTSAEQAFDDLTFLAARVCSTPIAFLSLVDRDRQWFKSQIGLMVNEIPRDAALCAYTILRTDLLIIRDTLSDERFAASPLVTSEPHIRFYAGAPIVTSEGAVIGTLCVADRIPRELRPEQLDALRALSRQVLAQLKLRRRLAAPRCDIPEHKRAEQALREANQRALTEYERLLDRVASLAQTLGTARNLATIFRALLDFAINSTPCSGLFISLYDEERDVRHAVYAWSEGEEEDLSKLPPMPMTESPHSRAVATGQIIITDDFQGALGDQPVVNIGLERDPRLPQSSLVVPMAVMGRIIGAVEAQSAEPAAFKQEHASAMRMAANLTAVAIENVRLFEREHEREAHLRQSQKMEAVGQLAGGIAHDFNNLIAVILLHSELMLRDLGQNCDLRRRAEEIRKASDRAAALTRQLLAFSRKQVLQPKVLDLNDVVADMNKLLQRLIGEHIELLTVTEAGLGKVKADPGQIEQVIMNLVVNARDAMPKGGRLAIETANVELDEDYSSRHIAVQPGRYVMLAVSDNGEGMDAQTQARVFEPFFTTKEQGKGTGLGLSTVYGIVKQSGGNIWVYSEVGWGTTFKIYLPRVDQAVEQVVPGDAQAILPHATETVLLVEDEEMILKAAREILELHGYRVLAASSSKEALVLCQTHRETIDLMITDVVMPQMGGPELAEQLRPLRPGMKVLYMSGYTDDAIAHHGVLEAGTAFLEKPFTTRALAHKVREVLNARVEN
jgi:two-component system, cell cycle sensor histidine kinase and response regulator CckA